MIATGRSAVMIMALAVVVGPLGFAGVGHAAGARATPRVGAAAVAETWHSAVPVAGTPGGNVDVESLSCGSAGNCSGGGSFIVNEVKGHWDRAIEVRGPGDNGGAAQVNSVSCASSGNCSAGGYYRDSAGHLQALVVTEAKGRWGTAMQVPGTAALNATGLAQVDAVSCTSSGDCGAGGQYRDGSFNMQAFVVSEVNGRWGKAVEAPGTAAVNKSGWAQVDAVSCASAGNCTAGGTYAGDSDAFQAFVISEANGRWGKAMEVPGTAAVNKSGWAQVNAVSCVSAGNCVAGGYYRDGSWHEQAFVAGEVNGRWGKAVEVPGTAALNKGGQAQVGTVSCGSAGSCGAGGYYTDGSGGLQGFVASEVKGRWGIAVEVPGTGALNKGGYAMVLSVSCGSAGNCSAGGTYADSSLHGQAFVAGEVNGRWGKAVEMPGTAALNKGGGNPDNANAGVTSVSCKQAAGCSALGWYTDSSGYLRAFVASES